MTKRHVLMLYDGPPADTGASDGPYVARWRSAGAPLVAISAFTEDDEPTAVFVSAAALRDGAWQLTVLIGFCADQATCNLLRDQGAAVIESAFSHSSSDAGMKLQISAPYFKDGEAATQLDGPPLLTLSWPYAPALGKADAAVPTSVRFELSTVAPDTVQSATVVVLQASTQMSFPVSRRVDLEAYAEVAAALRFPDLSPLLRKARKELWVGWFDTSTERGRARPAAGWFDTPTQPGAAVQRQAALPGGRKPGRPSVIRRRSMAEECSFGPSRFAFDDVEVIGFRLRLPGGTRDDLLDLIAPLNFRDDAELPGVADYSYAPASTTVLIELLRYGRMRCDPARPPLTAQDFKCQHELVVRMLVGRLDDDTAQAREAAAFAPAIFVDEPWSKVLGRELEGYPKELAAFCSAAHGPLRCDGRLVSGGPDLVPLTSVSEVRTLQVVGKPGQGAFFGVVYPGVSFNENFDQVDLGALSGRSWPGMGRWRQSDFDQHEFSRSFARAVMRPGFDEFRTVQTCPFLPRPNGAAPALIRGRFAFSAMQMQFPTGIAQLTLRPVQGLETTDSGTAWDKLIRLLGGASGHSATLSCLTGEWYRVKSNARLTIEESI